MKKLLTIAAASLAFAAVADTTYSPKIGVTAITTSYKNTIVAVPFTALDGSGAIAADDLVSTNGLALGTALYVFKDGTYYPFCLTAEGWSATESSSGSTTITVEQVEENKTVASGGAIWLVLPETPSEAKTFYIYGAYDTVPTTSSLAVGNNLIANPLQSAATITVTPESGDQIIVTKDEGADTYSYRVNSKTNAGAWRKDGAAASLPTIAVGQGICPAAFLLGCSEGHGIYDCQSSCHSAKLS